MKRFLYLLSIYMISCAVGNAQTDVTSSYITNPSFDGNVTGWTVNMPGAQNKGYQGSYYANGSSYLWQFIEAWVATPNYLGEGSLTQTISNLPEGEYRLEADMNARDQSNNNEPSGAFLIAESDANYKVEVATPSSFPVRYSLTFLNVGSNLTIGLRTTSDCTVNWVAFDNVKLYRLGSLSSDATSIEISESNVSMKLGDQHQLSAEITANDDLYKNAVWSSSDESIATVSNTGLVTALHTGSAVITATAIGSSLSATCRITVTKSDITPLVINEIQVANIDQTIDPSYNYGGWIELYNTGAESINLATIFVSDDATNLKKFQMPLTAGYVESKGYKNIWFNHNAADGNYGGESENNVNFKLETEGGTLYISDGDGELVTQMTYPACVPRCSYARTTDGGTEWATTSTPSPEASNAGSKFATERLAAPVVSRDGGVFEDGDVVSFKVTIPAGATLRYTTDGSTPTLTNGSTDKYGNFSVRGTSIYRFALFEDGYLPSPVVTRSFIYKNREYYLPVISVVTAPENLYDDVIGVYTKGTNGTSGNGRSDKCNWNRDWERPVNVEYLVPDGNEDVSYISVLNQETDFEIAGGWTRGYWGTTLDGHEWAMRGSFRLKCDKQYEGVNSMDYPVFPSKPHNRYKVWQVRNGGNDGSRTADAALNQIVLQSGFYVDAQDASPAHIFLNGEYLGMFNIRESNNRHYGDSNYGIDTDDMDQFDLSNAKYNQKVGDDTAWLELQELAKQSKTEATWTEICSRIDMDEFINYMALECFIGSSDWITNVNNVKGFRSRSDGKFHFVFFDADGAFYTGSMLQYILNNNYGANVDDLFRNLWNFTQFKKQFVDAFCIVNGSVMDPDFAYGVVEEFYNKINTAMTLEGGSASMNTAYNIQNYHNGSPMNTLQNCMGNYNKYTIELSSNISTAQLSLNGQQIPTGKFSGYMYNYNGNGIILTAKAPAGYVFKGWEQDGFISKGTKIATTVLPEASNWWYYDQGSMDNYSWTDDTFDPSTNGWANSQSPFGYGSNNNKYMSYSSNTKLDYGTDSNNKRPTYYFRNNIQLTEAPGSNETYVLHYKVDDGCRIHINGEDVGGYHCNEGATYYTYSTTYEGDTPHEDSLTITSNLIAGDNVIAIDVHNTSTNSSDIYFEGWITKTTVEGGVAGYVSTDETFSLTDAEDAGTYTIIAKYEAIEKQTARYEAGGTPVRINEVSAGNDIYINEYNKKEDWIELYNTTDEDVDVAGMYLSDNSKKPQKFQIPSSDDVNTIIPANGRLIVWCDELESLSQQHAPFKLSNSDGSCVSIQASDGTWADKLTYLEQPRWTTYGRYPDGGNFSILFSQPSIEKTNKLGTYDFVAHSQEWFLDEYSITLALTRGWNWTSHNMADAVDYSRFTGYATYMKSQTEDIYNDASLGWVGTLKRLSPDKGYKVKTTKVSEITLRGKIFNPETEVSVACGWNWIGFPLYNATDINAALQNYVATEGDIIIGFNKTATYSGGVWTGTLTALQPGQSYMMKTANSQTFTWNSLSESRQRSKRYVIDSGASSVEEYTPWSLDSHQYPNVMSMISRVEIDGEEIEDGSLKIGAFWGDECRGVSELSDGRYYMNIHGEGGEPLNFRIIDAEGETYEMEQKTTMQDLTLLGTLTNPYLLTVKTNETGVGGVHLASDVVSRQYYSLSGQRLTRPAGICLIKTTYKDGTVTTRKMKN